MSTQTTHLKLDLREAADIFNPLSTNANFESLDTIIYNMQTKGGIPTYTTTASANLLKLSENPTPNSTVFRFVATGDANTWSYQETVNEIVALDGTQKTVKTGEMYLAWVNSANKMVVIAWPDVVNAQTFDGKAPSEWATKVQLDEVNQTASNATQTAQAAASVANTALQAAQTAGEVFGDKQTLTAAPNATSFVGGNIFQSSNLFVLNLSVMLPPTTYVFYNNLIYTTSSAALLYVATLPGNPLKLAENELSFEPRSSAINYKGVSITLVRRNQSGTIQAINNGYAIYDSVTVKTYFTVPNIRVANDSFTAMECVSAKGLNMDVPYN